MHGHAKIAISLPQDLLKGIERERRSRGESRSAFFRRAVEAYLCREREREWDEQYLRAYREVPEGPEEEAWAKAGFAAIADVPWEGGGNK
jgi:metal-responsive CopG/Arc/MetJ family transcriptional regulator